MLFRSADLIRFSRFERRLRQIQDCYRELLDMLSDAGQETRVFANSYDYAIPSDKPVKLLGIPVAGPWMLPYFEQRGIPTALQADIVRLLIDGFCAAVDAVAAEPRGAGRLIRVETRGEVRSDWKDEIHPDRKGAIRVAKAFERALQAASILS